MILVPLNSVLYALALFSFSVAGYYGFRLTRIARKLKLMIMITQDGPQSIIGGIVILAVSQVLNLLNAELQAGSALVDFLNTTAVFLLVNSAVMFAIGFHKMYAVYLNERMRMDVNSILDELAETEQKTEEQHSKWQTEHR